MLKCGVLLHRRDLCIANLHPLHPRRESKETRRSTWSGLFGSKPPSHPTYKGGSRVEMWRGGIGLHSVNMPSSVPRRGRWDVSLMARPIPTGRPISNDGGLPQMSDGSAPAYDFSRPQQRSHDITACLLATPLNGVLSRRLRRFRYVHRHSDSYRLERPLPGRNCTY